MDPTRSGNPWQHGIFGCFDNCGICIVTYFLPCYTFGKNAEALGEDCCACGCLFCWCPGISFAAEVALRQRLRGIRQIHGTLTNDIMCVLCCSPCALCQEAQEIRAMQGGMAQNMARA